MSGAKPDDLSTQFHVSPRWTFGPRVFLFFYIKDFREKWKAQAWKDFHFQNCTWKISWKCFPLYSQYSWKKYTKSGNVRFGTLIVRF